MIRTVCNCKLHSMTGGLYHCEWHFPGNPARLGYQHHEDSCICWCRDDMPPRRRDVPCSPHFVVADEFSIFHDTDTHTQTDRRRDTHAHRHTAARKCLKSKVVPYSIVSVELISVSWQSAHRWLSHQSSGRLSSVSTRPAVTFPDKEIIPLTGTKLYLSLIHISEPTRPY